MAAITTCRLTTCGLSFPCRDLCWYSWCPTNTTNAFKACGCKMFTFTLCVWLYRSLLLQPVRPTVKQLLSHMDSYKTMKSKTSHWQQSPMGQTDSHATTKSDGSDWQSRNHKVRRVRLTVTQPQSPTGQTDSHATTKSDGSDWQSCNNKVSGTV